ncbi:uncharacterized protein LOC128193351 isoform X1 [Vigna angularis]|uniref:uncharacterized protein LOC128193351 isoform X1 n=1 Tax=Phaseolus angularis TaxID=3914 RepID=UPI0022B4CE53|nr:uncharacterized protein LOC128193351 isoform X1 [Vigna angularis]
MNCSQSVVSCLVSVAELVPRTNITGLQAPLGLFQLPIMQDWCFRYGCGSVKGYQNSNMWSSLLRYKWCALCVTVDFFLLLGEEALSQSHFCTHVYFSCVNCCIIWGTCLYIT